MADHNLSQLDQIFQKAPLGILMVDGQLRIVEVNPALLNSLGYQKETVKQSCLIDFCHPEDRSILENLFDQAEEAPGLFRRAEVRLLKGDSSDLWSEMTVGLNPPGDELPGRYLVIFQDIHQEKEMELEVAELHRRLNKRVEEERVQLAQDLHDGVMQDLHSIQYQLSALEPALPQDQKHLIENIMDSVQEVHQELRTISYRLRPPTLSRFGLGKSIRSQAEEFVEKHPKFNIKLDVVDDGIRLSEEIRLALFRIYQQALGNILQHSEASQIYVSLQLKGRGVEMLIEDDGKGFDLPGRWISLVREEHFGLAGSHDRVSALGGEFQVKSSPGEGTLLRVYIPDVLEVEEE